MKQSERNVCSKTTEDFYAALCFSLTDLKEMFSKATSRLLLTQASWFKIQFWTVSFPKERRHPCSPTLNVACNNTYSSLSSSLAWSLFVLILCVLVPALVPWRRVADSPSGLKAGCVWVNSAFLWFFFSPAFVRLRLFTVFLLLTFLVLFFLRW